MGREKPEAPLGEPEAGDAAELAVGVFEDAVERVEEAELAGDHSVVWNVVYELAWWWWGGGVVGWWCGW